MSHRSPQGSIVGLSSVLLATFGAVAVFVPVRPATARVQTLTGNYTYSWVDSRVAASLLYFERTYNSIDTRMSVLGPGWTHRFNVRLVHPDGYASEDRMVIGPDGASTTYEYDERDSLVAIHAPDGASRRYEYDERYHLTRSIMDPTDGGPARVVAYQHDGLGRLRLVQDMTDATAPVTTELTFDDRIVSGIWQR